MASPDVSSLPANRGHPGMPADGGARVSILTALFVGLVFCASFSQAAGAEVKSPYDGVLPAYRVTDTNAGLFDVAGRMALLEKTDQAVIRAEIERRRVAVTCRAVMSQPVIQSVVDIPPFYGDRDAWRLAVAPFFAFENAVSGLAAAFQATGDVYYAGCLVDMLARWARQDAFTQFHYSSDKRQAWYTIESVLFAAGLSYAIVRPFVSRDDRMEAIERWLNRASRTHLSIDTGRRGSCCNNHFYRRALHATIIGILTEDDALFRYGLSAPLMALSEMNPDGSLPREMERGYRAVHYQNYALLYLIPIIELAERQGYPFYDMEIGGRGIHDAVAFALDALEDPKVVSAYTDEPQDLWFMQDDQYFAWMEIYLSRLDEPRMEAFAARHRPIFNRNAGGAATMYFLKLKPGK